MNKVVKMIVKRCAPLGGGDGPLRPTPGRRTLNPRVGPPIMALGEGLEGVIWVLLLATEAPAELGCTRFVGEPILPPEVSSRAFAGTLMVVLALSRPAERGPSTGSG